MGLKASHIKAANLEGLGINNICLDNMDILGVQSFNLVDARFAAYKGEDSILGSRAQLTHELELSRI